MADVNVVNEFENKDGVRKYPLPQLKTQFPVKRNEFDKSVQNNEWCQWVYELSGLSSERFDKIKGLALGFSLAFPLVKDINRYETLVKYSYLYFVTDDIHAIESLDENLNKDTKVYQQLAQLLKHLEGNHEICTIKWKPYILALNAVSEYIMKDFNAIQRLRFIQEHNLYFEGLLEEYQFMTTKQKFTSFDQFIKIRLKCVGMPVYIQLIDYAYDLFVPEHVWDTPLWQKWMSYVNHYILFVNDMNSFEKELKDKEIFNSVLVIKDLERITIEEAVLRVAKLIEETESNILDIQKVLLKDCLPVTKTCIDMVNYMIGGIFTLHNHLDRYKKFN